MGTISTGVGLYSGINFDDTIDQLIAIDARPRDLILRRVSNIDAQRTALLDISARITAMLSSINSLAKRTFFESANATSSNENALSASVEAGAIPGAYTFNVRSLATTHQSVSGGFRSVNAGLNAGTVTIESAQAKVHSDTLLDSLNGFSGIDRGSFKLIDAEGTEATIDVSMSQSLSEVMDAINEAETNITASISGESLILTETTGGELRVREVDGGGTAESLGFGLGKTYSSSGTIAGNDLMKLSVDSPISQLNDGLGISWMNGTDDFKIGIGLGTDGTPTETIGVELGTIVKDSTSLMRLNEGNGPELGTIKISMRDGTKVEIDLSTAETMGDVKTMIEEATKDKNGDKRVGVTFASGRITVTDSSEPTDEEDLGKYEFKIEDLTGTAARDLGIAGTAEEKRINGNDILRMETISDVIAAINYAEGNYADGVSTVRASLAADGRGITLSSGGGTAGLSFKLMSGSSSALEDLGFVDGRTSDIDSQSVTGSRLAGGINTVLLSSLNGGVGIQGGEFQVDFGGTAFTVDATGAQTLRDVVDAINEQAETLGLELEAGYDKTGRKLEIRSLLDVPTTISISDVNGTMAEDLGINQTGYEITGDNLQRQYISANTDLGDLNNGKGIGSGSIKITDSRGVYTVVDLSYLDNMQDVIDEINDSGALVTARINDTGDGLVIEDNAAGTQAMKIESENGTVGRDLNILGEAEDGMIDGSFEYEFDVSNLDTLSTLSSRINDETQLASANIFNDGSSVSPYRLTITSAMSGLNGELIIDGGETGLDFDTLTRPQDAVITLGDSDNGGILLSSSSNTFEDVVEGMTLNAMDVGTGPVTVTVARDDAAVLEGVQGFVTSFNDAIDRIKELTKYDVETETRSVLMSDSAVNTVESRLYRMVSGLTTGAGSINRLSQVGISMGAGGKLEFDQEEFKEAYAADPENVIRFFTDEENGRAVKMKEIIESITDDNGVIDKRDDALENQQDALNSRVESMNELLDRKRDRLLKQFYAMEEALASMQAQQTSLSSLASLASSTSTSSLMS